MFDERAYSSCLLMWLVFRSGLKIDWAKLNEMLKRKDAK